jgi:hypothetical protein
VFSWCYLSGSGKSLFLCKYDPRLLSSSGAFGRLVLLLVFLRAHLL